MRRIDVGAVLCLLAVLLVAAVLRGRGISGRALWIDEAFCVRLAQLDWGQLVERSALDNHPPLFFGLLKLWMAGFGSAPVVLRSLELVIGVATVGLVYVLASRVGRGPASGAATERTSRIAATIAAAWIALQPVHVLWSAQVRMYALAGLLAVASGLLLVRALERPAAWSRWAAWTFVATALVYTHYFGAFVVLAQGLHAGIILLRSPAPDRRAGVVRMVVAVGAVCAAFAPWLAVVGAQSERVAAGWWVPPLTPSRLLWAWSRTAGLIVEDEFTIPSGGRALAVGGLAIALALVVVVAAAHRDRGVRLVAWCALSPVVGGVAVTLALGKNVVLARYLIVGQVFLPIAVVGLAFTRARRRAAALLLAPIAGVVVVALLGQVPVLAPRPDVAAAAAWIDQRRRPEDLLVVHQAHYWWFRIRSGERDPQLRLFTPTGRPIQTLGAALVTGDDLVIGPAELETARGRVFLVDMNVAKARVPASYRRVDGAQFAVWMPPGPQFSIDVTLYEATGAARP